MIKNFISTIKKLFKTGFFSITASNILSKSVAFVGGMLLVRILSKEDYGLYSYIMNTYGILALLGDFGASQAALQLANEEHTNLERKNCYFVMAVKLGLVGGGFSSILLILSPFFFPYSFETAIPFVLSQALLPFFSIMLTFQQMLLRTQDKNNHFAILSFTHTIIHYCVILPFSFLFGIQGAIYAQYIILFLTILLGLYFCRGLVSWKGPTDIISKLDKMYYVKLSLASQSDAAIYFLLTLLDVFLIGIFIKNTEIIASYKVASTIPSALLFIPSSLMVYCAPYFARNSSNIEWVKTNYKKIITLSIAGNALLTIFSILLSPIFISLIFGAEYNDTITCFKILMIGYFFSASFKIPSNNIIYTQRKIKFNLVMTVNSSIASIMLNIWLIPKIGSIGAAISNSTVSIFSSALGFCYMQSIFKKKAKLE